MALPILAAGMALRAGMPMGARVASRVGGRFFRRRAVGFVGRQAAYAGGLSMAGRAATMLRGRPAAALAGAAAVGIGGKLARGITGAGPVGNIVKSWSTGTAQFHMLDNGRIMTQKANGVWKSWRPSKHIVVSRKSLRAAARLAVVDRQLDKAIRTVERRARKGRK